MGIVHQVNLEYLAKVVQVRDIDGTHLALPDTLVGTDSHTTMVNGIGVLGWGVGGIEAEAVMLGQPLFLLSPVVVGIELVTALVLGYILTRRHADHPAPMLPIDLFSRPMFALSATACPPE